MHKTRDLAAYDVSVPIFDASLRGLGGCLYAPGASEGLVTEDQVFMFEAMHIRRGVCQDKLLAAREPLQAGLTGEQIYRRTPLAGLRKGWAARARAGRQ